MAMTKQEKLWRQAARKAEAKNTKVMAEAGPLFADDVKPEELTTTEEAYWDIRRSWALAPRGAEAGYLNSVDRAVDLLIIRNLARRFMSPKDFEVATAHQMNHGMPVDFWKTILLGRRRLVISYWRHVYGCRMNIPCQYYDGPEFIVEKRTEIGEDLVWPPEGWKAPLTAEELERHLALPTAHDFPNAVDPLNLA